MQKTARKVVSKCLLLLGLLVVSIVPLLLPRIPSPCHLFHRWVYTFFLCTYWVPGHAGRPREGHSTATEQLSSARPGATLQCLLTASVSPNQSLLRRLGRARHRVWCWGTLGRTDPLPVSWSSRTSRKTEKQIAANPELTTKQAEQ